MYFTSFEENRKRDAQRNGIFMTLSLIGVYFTSFEENRKMDAQKSGRFVILSLIGSV